MRVRSDQGRSLSGLCELRDEREVLAFVAMLAGSILLDAVVHPRPQLPLLPVGRSLVGLWLQFLLLITVFGLFQAGTGNSAASAVLTLAVMSLLVVVSNAKSAMLGEPLMFSDLALIVAVFRHPQFYMSALRPWQTVALAGGAVAMLAVLGQQFVLSLAPHLIGAGLILAALCMITVSLRLSPWRAIMVDPNAIKDVRRHGLLPTLLVYWWRWRASADPEPIGPVQRAADTVGGTPQVVVIVQCESFADPVELFENPALELPGLAAARAAAWQTGRLQVSGFGAYTMRTEYGLLFGRSEEALGFRRYDPFGTAVRETSYALPNRISGIDWRSLFLHPHDMRFYGRHRIMPASGFSELVGESRFAAPLPGEGRYVTDAAMAAEIVTLARAATNPTLLYAVTIENHGPWTARNSATDDGAGLTSGVLAQGYLHLAQNSDAMLTMLMAELATLERPAMLVFFGDHRPSIPGVSMPGGDRHTPYVMVCFDEAGRIVQGDKRELDLTPAELHHAIIDVLAGGMAAGKG